MTQPFAVAVAALAALTLPLRAWAVADSPQPLDLTRHWVGYTTLGLFVLAYGVVMLEEFTQLRKSKPVVLAAGVIWAAIAWAYVGSDLAPLMEAAIRHTLLDYAELMLFLLVAMIYINAMSERGVFDALRGWLIGKRYGYRQLFWMTGFLAFFISPFADNMTTALLMCAVVMAVGADSPRFISLSCINVVVAANAGGTFSPFGDVTTLMVWQKGVIDFWGFFPLFVPALVSYLVPAALMHFAVPQQPPRTHDANTAMKRGARRMVLLFAATIATSVAFYQFLHLPPVVGMMTGLAFLQFFGYYLKKTYRADLDTRARPTNQSGDFYEAGGFDIFQTVARAEWDTLLFFYGVILCVGGLGFIGYLALASQVLYGDLGATNANILIGLLSAVVDNIPVMFAVLSMNPDMATGQWLLVTLTAGIGGSLLSIGSAAGVALMGQARGVYTFVSHLRWTPAIALGYAAGIAAHRWLNAAQF